MTDSEYRQKICRLIEISNLAAAETNFAKLSDYKNEVEKIEKELNISNQDEKQ